MPILANQRATGLALELAAATTFATIIAPIMPVFGQRLWSCLGYPGPIDWSDAVDPVPEGQTIHTALLASRGVALAGEAPRLIGSATLCERYRLALTQFGCLRASIVEAAAESGLWRLAVQAGLVGRRAFAPAG